MVDGILGIGGRPGLTGAAERAVRAIPPHVTVVAVDLPSGVGPDDGSVPGVAVRADVTVTFGTAKPALLLPPAAHHVGRLHVVDIGLDAGRARAPPPSPGWSRPTWPPRGPGPTPATTSTAAGVLGVVAGGSTYTGAAVLATGAAVRSGAGMVRYVGPQAPTDLVRSHWPQVVPGEGRVQAWAVGSGVDPDDDQQRPHVEAALGERPAVPGRRRCARGGAASCRAHAAHARTPGSWPGC